MDINRTAGQARNITQKPKETNMTQMSGGIKTALALSIACLILFAAAAATAFAAPKTNMVRIVYVSPQKAEHQLVYQWLKEHRTLERLEEFLSPVRLPRVLTVSLQECDGEADAWYEADKITLCYEYVNELWKNKPVEKTPVLGLEPMDAVIGPLVDTSLHEFSHAIFDMLNIPVLGREEDAADQVAAYINLRFGKDIARRMVMGTAWAYGNEAKHAVPLALEKFANEHGTPAQRAYNELCIAYGADPITFGDVVTKELLPLARAEACGDEYKKVESAFNILILPHLDRAMAKKVMDSAWLPQNTAPLKK